MANQADRGPTGLGPSEIDLQLLREWREPMTLRRVVLAVLVSMIYHVVVIGSIVLAPDIERIESLPPITVDIRKAVPLYVPRELMQRDPNNGQVTHMLDVRSAAAPAAVPQAPRFRRPPPRPVTPAPVVPPVVPEPPKIEAEAAPVPPPLPAGQIPQAAAPPPPEKPKLAFENVGAGGTGPRTSYAPSLSSKVPDPRVVAENALRSSLQSGQGTSGVVVGDVDEMNVAASANTAAAAGPVRSNLQLLSDPKGFDFKPYLMQVLTAVRSNWLAVIPESARLGRKGRVLVQFIIDKRGGIPKLVIAESSGAAALDRAAVAGISASNPLPPLPSGFSGTEIRLQLAFAYNQPAGR
jgi:TonB family protein